MALAAQAGINRHQTRIVTLLQRTLHKPRRPWVNSRWFLMSWLSKKSCLHQDVSCVLTLRPLDVLMYCIWLCMHTLWDTIQCQTKTTHLNYSFSQQLSTELHPISIFKRSWRAFLIQETSIHSFRKNRIVGQCKLLSHWSGSGAADSASEQVHLRSFTVAS